MFSCGLIRKVVLSINNKTLKKRLKSYVVISVCVLHDTGKLLRPIEARCILTRDINSAR